MDRKKLIQYMLRGLGYLAAVVLAIAFIRSLLREGVAFADGLRNPYIWVCAVLAGASTAFGLWKKNGK